MKRGTSQLFEMLKWVKCEGSDIPVGAVDVDSHSEKPQYVGRIFLKETGDILPGN